MKKLITLFLSCFLFQAASMPAQMNSEPTQDLRILKLIPNLIDGIAIEPAIPNNFVAMSPHGELDASDWIYWGPEDVLKKYFQDQNSLSQAIIQVKLGNSSQSELEHTSLNEYKKMGFKNMRQMKLKWGQYPVYANCFSFGPLEMFMAVVGLNAPSDMTLLFTLVYPRHQKGPNEKDMMLWQNFLANTKPLTERQMFKALGQDLNEGYTFVHVGKARFKFLAELRESDQQLKLAIIPLDENSLFEIKEISLGAMGAKWNLGKPLTKVYGVITSGDGMINYLVPSCISILVKSVSEFSFNEEELLKQNPNAIIPKIADPNSLISEFKSSKA